MNKSEARFLAKKYRQSLSQNQLKQASSQIFERLLASDFWHAHNKSVMVFLPIYSHNEINTWPFIYHIFKQNSSELYVPCLQTDQNMQMRAAKLVPGQPLKFSSWGICEPAQPVWIVDISQISLILLPLLAFDDQGFRAGYGKGFYDRFVCDCPNALRVGLSLENSCAAALADTHAGDLKMDGCICPTNVYSW